jgi:LPPG:FO 2-phospho-L-lactate transferase
MPAVVVLAGGTGGAKLARGMFDVVGEDLTVIANTADDIEIYGAYVSPDPDLCTFWLADVIDERGWGLRDDSFAVMDGLRELGVDVWFALGDRDLAIAIRRRQRLDEGARLTDALAELGTALGLTARVLPMADAPVRTRVRSGGRWVGVQEFLIRAGSNAPIAGTELDGIDEARATPEALESIAAADAIIVGPSNPVISIGPILAVGAMREALLDSPAPVVAVSPIVGGAVLKGPTAQFMAADGFAPTAAGIASCYAGLIDGLVADEPADGVPLLRTDTLMSDPESRRRVAAETLRFAEALS